jgi:hypothetical protein
MSMAGLRVGRPFYASPRREDRPFGPPDCPIASERIETSAILGHHGRATAG